MTELIDTLRFVTTHPLTRHARIAALARFASWQVRSRLREELVVPWVHSTKLAVRRGMTGATGNIPYIEGRIRSSVPGKTFRCKVPGTNRKLCSSFSIGRLGDAVPLHGRLDGKAGGFLATSSVKMHVAMSAENAAV